MAWEPDYCTPAEFKAYARIPDLDILDDTQVALAITDASRAIDRFARRQFGKVGAAEVRYYTPEYDRATARWVVRIDDMHSVTDLAIAVDTEADGTYSTAVLTTDAVKFPLNAAAASRPWERLTFPSSLAVPTYAPGSLRVTANWGWAAVPSAVKQATLFQATRFLKRREAPFGTAGSPDMGTEIQLRDKVDVDVTVSLRAYRRQVWA